MCTRAAASPAHSRQADRLYPLLQVVSHSTSILTHAAGLCDVFSREPHVLFASANQRQTEQLVSGTAQFEMILLACSCVQKSFGKCCEPWMKGGNAVATRGYCTFTCDCGCGSRAAFTQLHVQLHQPLVMHESAD